MNEKFSERLNRIMFRNKFSLPGTLAVFLGSVLALKGYAQIEQYDDQPRDKEVTVRTLSGDQVHTTPGELTDKGLELLWMGAGVTAVGGALMLVAQRRPREDTDEDHHLPAPALQQPKRKRGELADVIPFPVKPPEAEEPETK